MFQSSLLTRSLKNVRQTQSAPKYVTYSTKPLQNINCILESSSSKGGLFLGDILSIKKAQILNKYNIKAVLSCMPSNKIGNEEELLEKGLRIKNIPVIDQPEYPISLYFEQSYSFISACRRAGMNVLVHCHAGVSRSAAIVCAYLMKENKQQFNLAFDHVKSRRERIRPNIGFIEQLKKYSYQLFGIKKNSKIQRMLTESNEQSRMMRSQMLRSARHHYFNYNSGDHESQRCNRLSSSYCPSQPSLYFCTTPSEPINHKKSLINSLQPNSLNSYPINIQPPQNLIQSHKTSLSNSLTHPQTQTKQYQLNDKYNNKFHKDTYQSRNTSTNFKDNQAFGLRFKNKLIAVTRNKNGSREKKEDEKMKIEKGNKENRTIQSINKEYKINVTQKNKLTNNSSTESLAYRKLGSHKKSQNLHTLR